MHEYVKLYDKTDFDDTKIMYAGSREALYLKHEFKYIDPSLSEYVSDVLAECIEESNKIIPIDFSPYEIWYDCINIFCAGISADLLAPYSKKFTVGTQMERLLSKNDLKFVFLHEIRHIWQLQKNLLTYELDTKKGAISTWHDGFNKSQTEIETIMCYNLDGYGQIPWEADANGFAHHIMNEYIPNDSFLQTVVKFCTKPKEFYR